MWSRIPTNLFVLVGGIIAIFLPACGDQRNEDWLSPPINIIATPGHRSVTLTWDPVLEADVYNVYWSDTMGALIDDSNKVAAVTPPFTQVGLTNDKAYYFSVTSVNSVGESTRSIESTATPIPGAPYENATGFFSPKDSILDQRFGSAVAIGYDIALVGAPGASHSGVVGAGAVFLFRKIPATGEWLESGSLRPSDPVTNGAFGSSVSLLRGKAIVGAPGATVGSAIGAGAAYYFTENPTTLLWTEAGRLTAPGPVSGDQFGASVSLTQTMMAVGAPGRESGGLTGSGEVYSYSVLDTLVTSAGVLALPTPEAGANFGNSVSIQNNELLIGAWNADPLVGGLPVADAGRAYIFTYDTISGLWDSGVELQSSTAAAGDQFGYAVSLSGIRAAVGAWKADTTPGTATLVDAGLVHVFTKDSLSNVWGPGAVIGAPDGADSANFGKSVALYDITLVVGAPYMANGDLLKSGAGYVFKLDPTWDTWNTGLRLPNLEPQADESMGFSVNITLGSIILGAPGRKVGATPTAGAIHAFE